MALSRKNPWSIISSQTVYQNPWIRIQEDAVINPAGERSLYAFVDWPGSVGTVAVDAQGRMLLIKEWNYPTKRWVWEIPSGGRGRYVSPLSDARRELFEETGLTAKHWHKLAEIQESPGITNDIKYLFLATGLTGKLKPQKTEGIQQVKFFTWVQLQKMLDKHQIKSAAAVAGVLLAKNYLDR